MRTVDPNSSYRETHKQEDAEPKCRPISLLSSLEAENVRLRQAIVELSRDAKTLKEALNKWKLDQVVAVSIGPHRTCQGRRHLRRMRKRSSATTFEPAVLISPLIEHAHSWLCGTRGLQARRTPFGADHN
jgi:hypothetical protein